MCKKQIGLTLLELMLVLALSGLTCVLAVPCYQNYICRNRLRVATDQLIYGIEMAKHRALCEEGRVVFSSVDGGKWQGGQQLVRERDRRVLAGLPALQPGVTVEWRGNLGQTDDICFDGSGLPEGQWGSFWLHAKGYSGHVRLVMNGAGRLAIQH